MRPRIGMMRIKRIWDITLFRGINFGFPTLVMGSILAGCDPLTCSSSQHHENVEITAKKITYERFINKTEALGLESFMADSVVVKDNRGPQSMGFKTARKYDVYFSYPDKVTGKTKFLMALIFLDNCNEYIDHFSDEITQQEYFAVKQEMAEWGR